jgi:molecular chaperone DnaJ
MATAQRDYYEVLGVPRDADQAAIKDAFRRLALQYHPDRNKEPGAEERFKEIAAAYAVLSDPRKRADYDAGGLAGVAAEHLWSGLDLEEVFGGLGLDLGETLFDRFFGRGRRRRGPARGPDLEVPLEVTLERVATGGEETVRVTRPGACGACGGSGARAGTRPRACETCGGTGQHVASRREAGITVQQISICPGCHGRGQIIDQPCPECAGRGQAAAEEALGVKIPPGVEDGTVLRIPGRGLPSPEPGGGPGDLHVLVRTAPDSRFERDGADLWRVETVEVAEAALGTTLGVPTLDGPATVTVPPGTQPDSVLRLRAKGLPGPGGRGRGDLYLRVRVHIPGELGPEERDAYERLRALGASRRGLSRRVRAGPVGPVGTASQK